MPKMDHRRRTRPAFEPEQGFLQKLIDLNPYGILVTDAAGRPLHANPACEELFGSCAAPPDYSVLNDPLMIRGGFGPTLKRLRQGKAIEPIETWYDPHEVNPRVPSKPVCLRTTMFPITADDGRVRNVVLMHEDITARRRAEEMYARREAILQAIADCARRLLETPAWEGCMDRMLAAIGQAAQTSRAYLFAQTRPGAIKLLYHWEARGVKAVAAEDVREHPLSRGAFARWNRLLREGRALQGCVETFPRRERLALEARGTRSVLQIPLIVEGQWWGFLGFDDCTRSREWSEGEVAALQTLAGLLASAIQRNRMEQALQSANEQLEARVAERTAELSEMNARLARQVAAQHQAEQRLSDSQARLRAFIQALPDPPLIVNERGQCTDLLDAAEDQPRGTLARRVPRKPETFPRDQAKAIREVVRRTLNSGATQTHEYRVDESGQARWFEARTAPIQEAASGKRSVVWLARDVTERKRSLVALEESEANYRALVDNLNVGVQRVAELPKPRCVQANHVCARIFGYDSVEEFMASPPARRYVNPKDRQAILALLARRGSLRDREIAIRRKDGSEALISCTLTAHLNDERRIDYVDAIIEDITERKQDERRLTLLFQAFEQSTEGIAVADTSRRVLFANQAFAAMHDLKVEEVVGRPVTIFHSPQQVRHAVHDVLRAVHRTGRFEGRVWHQRRDGIAFPTLMTVSAMRNEQHQLVGYIATALDITEQMQTESQRQTLARAVENAGEGIGILDRNWHVSYANASLGKALAVADPGGLIGRDWLSFLCDGADRVADMVKVLQKRPRWTGRLFGRLPDDKTVPLAVTLARMASAESAGSIIASVRDQTAEEAYLAQIRQLTLSAARALEEERARLSRELHDQLGQTLTAINLDLAWLTTRSEGWDRGARERLAEVKQFVNQMLDSIRSLSTSLRPPILDNRGLLEAVRSFAADFSRRSGIACRVSAVPSDLEVHDPEATTLFRIFQEAMTNVARHSRASRCGIFLRVVGGDIELKIRDSGVGAVPKRLEGVQSLGIAGMRERAVSVGGVVTVENRPEGGVCVTARMPWQQVKKRDDL